MVIAIDGPGGVGKSTVARGVAARLGYDYLDTGATYRAATLAVLRAGVDPNDAAGALEVVAAARIAFIDGRIHLNGEPVVDEVRSPDVTAAVSPVSAMPAVRELIVEIQREWVAERGGSAVVEGRDIGTVVFPDAPVKIFLTAGPEIRAVRRAGDAETSGVPVGRIREELERRDRYDATREASPMLPAADAVVIDTSDLSADEVIEAVLGLAATAETQDQVGPL